MYIDKIEIPATPVSSDAEMAKTALTQLSELDLCLIGGGMGDVQQ